MKLFYSPGACSLGIHILLEEIDKPYTLSLVDLKSGVQYSSEYIKVNPKSKVPALLRDDETLLTEYPAIALWLAKSNPEKNLIPTDLEGEVRTMEALDYIVSSLHMQGFSRLFVPAKFSSVESEQDAIRAAGKEIVTKGLGHLSSQLGDRAFIVGENFSIADSALFYLLHWCGMFGIEVPANLQAYFERLKARPAIQKAMRQEGLLEG